MDPPSFRPIIQTLPMMNTKLTVTKDLVSFIVDEYGNIVQPSGADSNAEGDLPVEVAENGVEESSVRPSLDGVPSKLFAPTANTVNQQRKKVCKIMIVNISFILTTRIF